MAPHARSAQSQIRLNSPIAVRGHAPKPSRGSVSGADHARLFGQRVTLDSVCGRARGRGCECRQGHVARALCSWNTRMAESPPHPPAFRPSAALGATNVGNRGSERDDSCSLMFWTQRGVDSSDPLRSGRSRYDGLSVPKWRNRQTRRSQTPLRATSCGFESHLRHHASADPATRNGPSRVGDGPFLPSRGVTFRAGSAASRPGSVCCGR
jgi:hypothetical protein